MIRIFIILVCTMFVAVFLFCFAFPGRTVSVHAAQDPGQTTNDATRDADIAMLKDRVPDQAHAMISVAYHFNNLWFAAKAKNWPLAEFYLNETRSHLKWAVRIIPIRKDSAGREIKMNEILEAVENSLLSELLESVKSQNELQFEQNYKLMLEAGCYSCHKAADKPYLRPQIPTNPAEAMMNFDPKAIWPIYRTCYNHASHDVIMRRINV